MRRAIVLSAMGLGSTSPNPPVGCVILDGSGRVVGEGYHQRKGEPHAEVLALSMAGDRAVGGTAAVTLEPCNHHGRTPPCHKALIDAGVARVLVAVLDPTSRGEGGVARLRQARVDVEVDVLRPEAMLVLEPWLTALRAKRPRVLWSYRVAEGHRGAVPDELLRDAGLLESVDAVLTDDGTVVEAIPGRHGAGAFEIVATASGTDPAGVLSSLYSGGVRVLLLNGAAPSVEVRYVDEIAAFLSVPQPGHGLGVEGSVFPAGFQLRALRPLVGSSLIASAVPSPEDSSTQ